jgi:vitamin B12 transporter
MTRAARALLFVLFCSLPNIASASPVTGSVTDPSGAALARAFVRLVDAAGQTRASLMTDDRGQFVIDLSSCAGCRIDATLVGFRSASRTITARDANDAAFRPRLTLELAPITDAVVVTPTREAAPAGQLGATVTVFTADDIARRGTTSLADLLRETPGVGVIETAGLGGVTSLFLRGGASNYTKVLLDGIPLNEPGGTFNFGNITTSNLARVEVVRGAQSALFGTDAMSGVIQLVTARGTASARPAFTGAIEAGGYGTDRADGTVRGGARGWDYSLGVSRLRTDNRAANNRFDSTTVSWSAGKALTRALEIRAVGRVEDGRAGAPGQTAFGRADMDAFYDHTDTTTGVSLEHRVSAAWQQRISYSLSRSRQDSTNLLADAPYTPQYGAAVSPYEFYDYNYDSHNVLRRGAFSYQSDWRFGGAVTQFITTAIDWDSERATLGDRLAQSTLGAARDNVGVSVQHQLIGRHGSIVTSLRAEHNESFGNEWVPRMSAALMLRQSQGAWGDLTLKANAGRGVKEPTILQSFSENTFYLGNPDLRPERARTADIGLSQRLAGDRVRVDAVWFDNQFRDQISTRTLSVSPYRSQYFNMDAANARGVELSTELAPVTALRITAGYTRLTAADLFRRPQHSGFVRAAVTAGRLSVDLDGLYEGRYLDNDFASLSPAITSSGGFWRWDVAGRYRLTARLEGYARVQNLTDRNYMEPLGYLAWRRTAHAGLKVRF